VSVSIRRSSDNGCWNGTSWGSLATCFTPLAPAFVQGGSPAWTIPVPCGVDTYTVYVFSTDNVGNAIPGLGNQQTATITSCA
jgi:hypothetical protein